MVKGTDKTYGQLILDSQKMISDDQQVGETVQPIMKQLENIIRQIGQMQYDICQKKGFHLSKYYIHIYIVKEPLAYQGMGVNNHLLIRKPHVRYTRPSPYQEEDHYLWSVTNYENVKFEWCVPSNEMLSMILANPNEFDKSYVKLLRDFCNDKIDKIEDYMLEGKVQ